MKRRWLRIALESFLIAEWQLNQTSRCVLARRQTLSLPVTVACATFASPEMKTNLPELVKARVTPAVKRELARIATRLGISESSLLRDEVLVPYLRFDEPKNKRTKRMNLIGKSREQIEQATKDLKRHELIDLLYSLATCEPMFKPQEIAARRGMSKQSILKLIKRGVLRAHKPLENAYRVPLSAIREWDAQTAVFFDSASSAGEE
jgi:excisionase family DNA binding protein